jgi:hypothetical protein
MTGAMRRIVLPSQRVVKDSVPRLSSSTQQYPFHVSFAAIFPSGGDTCAGPPRGLNRNEAMTNLF